MTATVSRTGEDEHPKVPESQSTYPRWLKLPEPVRRVFNQFPLITYEENQLPQRTPQKRMKNVLYVFSQEGVTNGNVLSYNPSCLKWQTYLLLKNIPFCQQPANNHASPTGSLPFLIPATKSTGSLPLPISSGKLRRWIGQQGVEEESVQVHLDTYSALIDQNLRQAWLFNLYLTTSNFDSVAKPLYIEPASTHRLVQWSLQHQLETAAQEQLLLNCDIIDREEIYESAERAFKSLNTLLGNQKFFYSSTQPGLFDAAVFAYTYPLLLFHTLANPFGIQWQDQTLLNILLQHQGLVDHQKRILDMCTNS